ncbi:MAG: pyrroline-5-carboxylate reductase [Alphaproteobacteria bacterium]|nr:pyrroline-5-carboxylate reductase [Alphaproteobacteria bacterium]
MRRRQADMFSDLAKMANGAASALGDLRSEVQTVMTARQERGQAAAGMVLREDFDAALARIEALAGRVAMLEAQLAAQQPKPSKPPAKKSRPAKAAATRRKKADSA